MQTNRSYEFLSKIALVARQRIWEDEGQIKGRKVRRGWSIVFASVFRHFNNVRRRHAMCASPSSYCFIVTFDTFLRPVMAEQATSSLVTTGWSCMLAAEGETGPAGPNLLPVPSGLW